MLLTLFASLGLQAAEVQVDPPQDFSWLSGHWVDRPGHAEAPALARYSEEIWSQTNGTLMTGMNRTVQGGHRTSFEFMRIEFRYPAVLIAQPGGGEPVSFVLIDHGENFAHFENPDHDFPTDIVYARVGNTLMARVSGPRYGPDNAIEFRWTLRAD